jgi:hypothetical protein
MHSHAYFLTVRSTLSVLVCSLFHCSGRKSDRRIFARGWKWLRLHMRAQIIPFGGHGHRHGLSRHPEQSGATAPCPSPWRTTHCERSLSESRKPKAHMAPMPGGAGRYAVGWAKASGSPVLPYSLPGIRPDRPGRTGVVPSPFGPAAACGGAGRCLPCRLSERTAPGTRPGAGGPAAEPSRWGGLLARSLRTHWPPPDQGGPSWCPDRWRGRACGASSSRLPPRRARRSPRSRPGRSGAGRRVRWPPRRSRPGC